MHSRLGLVRVLAAMVVLALAVGVPTASAGPKLDRKQTKAIAKGAKAIKNIRKSAKTAAAAVAAIKVTADRGDKNATAILGLAPSIVAGLQATAAGLTSLKTLATATEYGFGQVIISQPALAPQAGSFVVTPDIPDSVQQAQTTQQFIAQHDGALIVSYGVRSFETDGDGTVAAAHCRVTVTNEAGATATTAPNGALGGLPFQPVLTKSAPTSTVVGNESFPFGLKTVAPDADVTQNLVTAVAVTTNDTYTVGMSCVDTSPNATDPSA